MEKKDPQNYSNFVYRPVVARGDLEFVLATLKAGNLVARIENSDFVFVSLDELAEKYGNRPKGLQIWATPPSEKGSFILVQFLSGLVHVYLSGSGEIRSTYFEILHYLQGRRKGWPSGNLTLRPKHDSFWQRNSERVVLLVVGSLLGGLVSYLVQVATRFSKGQ